MTQVTFDKDLGPGRRFQPQPDRPPPPGTTGALGWLRQNLFSSPFNAAVTLISAALVILYLPGFFDWALVDALWQSGEIDPATGNYRPVACQAHEGGACWVFIRNWFRFIMFGTYPYDAHWRPAIVSLLCVVLVVCSCLPWFWRLRLGSIPALALLWPALLLIMGVLMWGGVLGLQPVSSERFGGLPVTLGLTVLGLSLGFPLAVLLALGRRSDLPIFRTLAIVFIEVIRGVPLITLLLMAGYMFPFLLPDGVSTNGLVRTLIALILFAAAYMAEAVRGGLQSLPKGQFEAADALGLSGAQRTRLIILPQALAVSIPPLMNTVLSFLKDTTLVIIVGQYDLLLTTRTAINDRGWLGNYLEGYVFIGLVYWLLCFSLSRYSVWLERQVRAGRQR